MMDQTFELLGFHQIKEQLKEYANSRQAKEEAGGLAPILSEGSLRKSLRDTTQARRLLEEDGAPPLPIMDRLDESVGRAVKGELLLPDQLEQVGLFLVSVKRLKSYLEKGRERQVGLAFYSDNLACLDELLEEICRTVRGGRVEDSASALLGDIRRKIQLLEEKVKQKAESTLQANRSYASDSFVVTRNGRICIPVKKEYRGKVPGAVVDKSSTGATLFIEPRQVAELLDELEIYRLDEDAEERRILYSLTDKVAEREPELLEDIRVIAKLDFIFAKGKMSLGMDAVEPSINLERYICLEQARHPLLDRDICVPLDFQIGNGVRGVVITGPNTGGKTVAIKTVALMCMMACSGLHVPCRMAQIAMNSQVLCDIGDGQDISDNLSTFSAHIRNVIHILQRVNEESLVVLDELGSGTDPAEGMGIAISILEQLRESGCLFLATTHYPEVKEYAGRHQEILNARMAFDRESLKPLYSLEIGKAGESCALYIAKRLGIPNRMLQMAAREAYGSQAGRLFEELGLLQDDGGFKRAASPRIKRASDLRRQVEHGQGFRRGDSVTVLPDGVIGIVVSPADAHGDVLVQVKGRKVAVSHKRLKLKAPAEMLYPEDYDFSILFDSAEDRKKRHQMGKRHQPGMVICHEADEKGI